MNRFNLFLTAVIAVIFVLLMIFAGQPLTPEADLVQRWYTTLCNPTADPSFLLRWTWRGQLSDAQLQAAVNAHRANNNFTAGCTAVVNHNVIYFQWIPPELTATVERIKFVAVNVTPAGQTPNPNHISSLINGVPVLYYKNGDVKILPHFIPDSPLGLHTTSAPVPLYNNDGLLMGQVRLNGAIIQLSADDAVRLGVPLVLSTNRTWGQYWIRFYADGVEVAPERFTNVLPADQQPTFLLPVYEYIPAGTELQGIVWFSVRHLPTSIRLGVEARQTIWDMPTLPVMLQPPLIFTLASNLNSMVSFWRNDTWYQKEHG